MRILNSSYEMVPVKELRQHPGNPNQGDVGAIFVSIEVSGFYGVLIVQRSTRYILVGNHRYVSARQAGATEIPVIWVDVTDDEAEKIMLADNRLGELASRDPEMLAALLTKMANADPQHGLDGTGYDGDDLDDIIKGLAQGMPPEPQTSTAPSSSDGGAPIVEPSLCTCPKCGHQFSAEDGK